MATPVVAYVLGPVLRRKEYLAWVSLGNVTDFQPGETRLVTFRNPFTGSMGRRHGQRSRLRALLRAWQVHRLRHQLRASRLPGALVLRVAALHVPCHGGVYYADGSRASGPPERGLFTYELKIENGKLMIRAGQIATLRNRAGRSPCPESATTASLPRSSRGSNHARRTDDPGTSASTIG